MLSVILTFVPRQHALKVNKHGNVNKSPPKNIYFLIVGVENKYFFGKSERTWAHELTSQMGGELMSWSPSVSAALYCSQYKKGQITWKITETLAHGYSSESTQKELSNEYQHDRV